MTLTVDDLREHVGSSLGDAALGLLLDSAYGSIAEAIGPLGDINELQPALYGPLLMLSRAASALVTVIENDITLDEDDYELRSSGQTLRRLDTGPNPRSRWGRTDITYTPLVSEDDRDRVAIQLVKLEITYQPALSSQSSDSWSESYGPTGIGEGSYADRRNSLLESLGGGSGFLR